MSLHNRATGCCLLTIVAFFLLSQPAFCQEQASPTSSIDSTTRPLAAKDAETLQPGLTPFYFRNFYARDLRQLPGLKKTHKKGEMGEPILKLNHQFGNGMVFDSGTNKGVGIRMIGAINFDHTGEYRFQALSNDGFQLYLGDTLIVNDPKQHSDQLSEIGSIVIDEPGWYPLRIDYFQRKGTAALKLFWETPQNTEMTIVPASAYAHQPEK